MLAINEEANKITVKNLAACFGCTPRTIYRNMTDQLRKEKQLLNEEI